MTTLIIGGSGFVGRHLAEHLLSNGHDVVVSTRNLSKARLLLGKRFEYIAWDGVDPGQLSPYLDNIDAVVNLAGEDISGGRWSDNKKILLTESRVRTGHALAEAFITSGKNPSVLIQGSAIGIYGKNADLPAGENREYGTGFLAEMVQQWEQSVSLLADSSKRLVFVRMGPVLGKKSGILPRLNQPFNFGMGVIPGNGRQWISWIHILDVVNAIRFLIENPVAKGPFNLTAPVPVTLRQMIQAMGKIRKRPAWLSIPPLFLKMAFGEMAEETILASQDALPEALLQAGYSFQYHNIGEALADLLKK